MYYIFYFVYFGYGMVKIYDVWNYEKKIVYLSFDCLIYICIIIYNIYMSNIILGIIVSCRS